MMPTEGKIYADIDVEFADLMVRLAGKNSSSSLKKYALELSLAVRSGAGYIPVDDETALAELRQARPSVGCYPEDGWSSPLLLEGNRLYFQRLLRLENRLAELMLDLAANPVPPPPPDRVDEIFSRLPPSSSMSLPMAR